MFKIIAIIALLFISGGAMADNSTTATFAGGCF